MQTETRLMLILLDQVLSKLEKNLKRCQRRRLAEDLVQAGGSRDA
jgi:ribosome-associated translation inhibitor RaiA